MNHGFTGPRRNSAWFKRHTSQGPWLAALTFFSFVFVAAFAVAPTLAQTIPTQCQNDIGGANDEPGQKDLTRFCVDSGTGDYELNALWNWDLQMIAGGSTADACTLYDTDGDFLANLAICVTIVDGGQPATLSNVRLFTCNDSRPDRCAGDTQLAVNRCSISGGVCSLSSDCTNPADDCVPDPATTNTVCTVSQQNTDPFPTGQDYPVDSRAVCFVDLDDFGLSGASATLIDTCSFPSEIPNSDPSDCILFQDCTENSDCDDENACTTDTCALIPNTNSKSCRFTPDPGESCDDGMFCTVNDACSDLGFCQGGGSQTCGDQSFCTDDSCNEADDRCDFLPKPATTPCGSANDADCDAADMCDGSGTCVDRVDPDSAVCRPAAAGGCDVAESCNGTTKTCPDNAFQAAGTGCGGSAADCDALDTCDGSGTCVDRVDPDSTVCRTAADACDAAENCNGSTKTCPDNAFQAAGTGCGGSAADCDALDTCDGSGTCVDRVDPDSTVCRTAADACDAAENCNGSTKTCPDNAFQGAGTGCGGSAADCDALDTCDGSGTCVDNVDPNSTMCRPAAAGGCDLAENCNGTTKTCPDNAFQGAGTGCGGSAADCDALDTCDGSGTCVDNVDPNSTMCRPAAAGGCDVAENCNGTTKTCPTNAFQGAGTGCGGSAADCDALDTCDGSGTCVDRVDPNSIVCRPAAAGGCDVAENCNGTTKTCPTNAFQGAGTGCGGSAADCDALDTCDGSGGCVDRVDPASTVCRPAANACDVPESCTGTTKTCRDNEFAPADTRCGDGTTNVCTDPDTCDDSGLCLPNNKPCSYVTNSELCQFDFDGVRPGRQFNVAFTPDVQIWPGYKLNATNPGQYYYNAIVTGAPDCDGSVTMNIPWPFVTQGANPVHLYDADTIGINANFCFRDGSQLPVNGEAFPATITYGDWASGTPKSGLGSAGDAYDVWCTPVPPGTLPNGLANPYHCEVTVDFTIPASGKAYVNIHLDYGVKGLTTDFNPKDTFADRYDKGTGTCVGATTYFDALKNDNNNTPAGPLALRTCTMYPFSHEGAGAGSDSVQNVNTFKRINGVFGRAGWSATGAPAPGSTVTLRRTSTNAIVATGVTDADGFYSLDYKHTGQRADYTVILGTGPGAVSRVVQLKANGWAEASYDYSTATWYTAVVGN